jgi:RHS repeat-associated protein
MINSGQSTVASYRYDPFGRMISQSGTLAGANVYRFSSKEWHHPSGLYYYGYRFYDPNLQRWLNRDTVSDFGLQRLRRGRQQLHELRELLNLSAFVGNNSLRREFNCGAGCYSDLSNT